MSWTAFRSRGETPRTAPKHRTATDRSTPVQVDDTPGLTRSEERAKRDFVARIKAALAA